MKKNKRGMLLITILCSLLFAATCASSYAAMNEEQPIDANNPTIMIHQEHKYGSDDGYAMKITSDVLTEGELVFGGYIYEMNKEYTLPERMQFYNNYVQIDPYDHFTIGQTEYAFHLLSSEEPGSYTPAPPLGEMMEYNYKVELVPAKMPIDVVFTGETTISCYVGDDIMSNQGITVDDNGEDITDMVSGEKVDTSKASKVTYSWYIAGRSGNMVTFTRVFIIQAKQSPAQQETTVTPDPTTTKPAVTPTPKAKKVTTTALVKGSGSVAISGPGKCHKNKKKLWITTDKGKKVTLKAKGKKFKYWQKKVGKKYKKYSKKKTIKVKASKNTTYRAVFKK